MIVSNDCGEDTFNLSLYVEIVEASFQIDEEGGCIPHTVNFQNSSLGTIDNFLWTFEGGSPATSTDVEPQVIYESAGLFDVQLEVFGAQGSDNVLMDNIIEVLEVPVANFDFSSPILGTINFINNSSDGTFYEWNFGDGSPVSNEEMPLHIYDIFGNFVVTLTASNEYCSNTFTDTISILTSMDELELADVNIFPNPTSDFITIELQDLGNAEFEVFSIEGKRIDFLRGEFNNFKKIEIKSIPTGVYMISILQKGKRGIYRFVKME